LLNQWFLNIRKYADEMLEDLDKLEKWNSHVKELQKGWIGKSYGAKIDFKLRIYQGKDVAAEYLIQIFTTRPDTIFGVSFLALAHDSPKIKELLQSNQDNWIDQNAYERYIE